MIKIVIKVIREVITWGVTHNRTGYSLCRPIIDLQLRLEPCTPFMFYASVAGFRFNPRLDLRSLLCCLKSESSVLELTTLVDPINREPVEHNRALIHLPCVIYHCAVPHCHVSPRDQPWRGSGRVKRRRLKGLCLPRVATWPAISRSPSWVKHRSSHTYVRHMSLRDPLATKSWVGSHTMGLMSVKKQMRLTTKVRCFFWKTYVSHT
jgi:hypothetical protein